ncbi:WD40 repeat domain-containing protein [Catenulispora rubra]|uniref:WD40 repeat domain-containing protein n=1 Tax=Catenulispora rubra TaxID=280293 RepID=UPI00189217D4|nr:WD40 repeat domain-containing protein [Catenulispora rubra]
MDAARYGNRELSRSFAEVAIPRDTDDSWAVQWATGRGLDSRLRCALPVPAKVTVVAAAVVQGRGFVVAGCEDGALRWWDLATGRELGQAVPGYSREVSALTTAVLDGRPIAVASGFMDGIRVWDLAEGEQIGAFDIGDGYFVKSLVAGLVEGRPVVVAASTENVLRVWDLDALVRGDEPLIIQTGFVCALTTSVLGGRPVVVTSHSKELMPTDLITGEEFLRFWDLVTGREIGPRASDPAPPISGDDEEESGLCTSLSFNTQAKFLVTDPEWERPMAVSATSYEVHVWDLATGEMLGEPVLGGFADTAATGALDGRPAALISSREGAEVWDVSTRENLRPPLIGHLGDVRGTAMPVLNGRHLAVTGSDDRSVRIWDLDNDGEVGSWQADHLRSMGGFVTALVDGRSVIISGDRDDEVRIRSLDDGAQIGAPLPGPAGNVRLMTVGMVEGRLTLFTRDRDRNVRIWDLADRKELHGRTTREYGIDGIAFFGVVQDRFVAVTREGRVWDLTTNKWTGVQPKQRRAHALALETLEGRDVILVSDETSTAVHLCDLATGEEAGPPLVGHTDSVWAAATGILDGRPIVATGSDDRTLRVWDASTGRQIGQYAFPAGVWDVAVAPDGRLVAAFGSDMAVLAPR